MSTNNNNNNNMSTHLNNNNEELDGAPNMAQSTSNAITNTLEQPQEEEDHLKVCCCKQEEIDHRGFPKFEPWVTTFDMCLYFRVKGGVRSKHHNR